MQAWWFYAKYSIEIIQEELLKRIQYFGTQNFISHLTQKQAISNF